MPALTRLNRLKSGGALVNRDLRIGVIGGAGRMGSFLLRVFSGAGIKRLYLSDISPAAKNRAEELGVGYVGSNEELASECDITVVSVLPIGSTPDVIARVGPNIKKGGLLMHQTSVQSPGAQAMEAFGQCSHIGLHIMSQPEDDISLRNKNVILLPGKDEYDWERTVRAVFSGTRARLFRTDAITHDIMLALIHVQGHMSGLLSGFVLSKAAGLHGISADQLTQIQTQGFLLGMLGLGRMVSSRNPRIYLDIQRDNPFAPGIRQLFLDGLYYLTGAIERNDERAFRLFFEELAGFYGLDAADRAKRASDAMIRKMRPSRK